MTSERTETLTLKELDQDTVTGPRVEERDRALGAAPRCAVDELDAVDREPRQLLREVGDLEADVVEALALVSQEPGHARRVVGRLNELDLRLPDGEEGDPARRGGQPRVRTARDERQVDAARRGTRTAKEPGVPPAALSLQRSTRGTSGGSGVVVREGRPSLETYRPWVQLQRDPGFTSV